MSLPRSKSLKVPSPRPLRITNNEWDFSTCPEPQLRWCDFYEHSRENAQITAAVVHFHEHGTWAPNDLGLFPDDRYRVLAEELFRSFPEFPIKPFLRISEQDRAARCEALETLRASLVVLVLKAQHNPE